MSTIVTRAGKGSALTNTEVDSNFTNLNTDKIEAGTTVTLTNKTLTSPKINEILDTSGNEILGLSPTASATDFLTVKNGIGTGVPLHVYADGPSTNIGLHIQPKGSGLVTISDGTDFNKGIRFRSSSSAASAITLLDAVSTAGRVVTLPDATTTLVGRDTTDTLTNKTINLTSNTLVATSAQILAAVTDETGTGALVFANTPTLVTPILGTPTSATLTNATGLPLTTGVTGTLPTANGGTGLSSFTSGGVVYASSTSALATGSVLNFNGSNLSLIEANGSGAKSILMQGGATAGDYGIISVANGSTIRGRIVADASSDVFRFDTAGGASTAYTWLIGASYTEGMRLTTTGLGIGTSSPAQSLHVKTSTSATPITLGVLSNATGLPALSFNGAYASTTMAGIYANGATSTSLYYEVPSGNSHFWGIADSTKMTLDSAGNLGLGVTPPTWGSGYKAFQISNTGSVVGTSGSLQTFNNAYDLAGTFKYLTNDLASRYYQYQGTHVWMNAPSGTAGNTVTFTQAMTLDASGNLALGATSASSRLDVTGGSGTSLISRIISQVSSGSYLGFLDTSTTDRPMIGAVGDNFVMRTGSVERFRIGTSGQLGIGGATYGTSGQVLTSGGSGAAPTWSTPSGISTGKAIAMAIVFGG